MTVDSTRAAAERAKESVQARETELATVATAIATEQATLMDLEAKELKANEALTERNARVRLRRLEQRRDEVRAALQRAREDLATAEGEVRSAEHAERQARIAEDASAIDLLVSRIGEKLAERFSAHQALITDANRHDPPGISAQKMRRGSEWADVDLRDVFSAIATVLAARKKAAGRRRLLEVPAPPAPSTAVPEEAAAAAGSEAGIAYVPAGVGAPPGDWNTAMVRHVEHQAAVTAGGAGPGRCASDVNVSE